jgi:cell wall-associated NlpC family hydrolase
VEYDYHLFTLKERILMKKLIPMVLAGALLIPSAVSAETGTVKDYPNFRSTHSMDSKVYGNIPNGTDVKILGKNGNWVKVEYQGETGYIYERYISIAKDSSKSSKGNENRQQQGNHYWKSIQTPKRASQKELARFIIQHLEKENISKTRLDIIKAGLKYLGTPYVYGSSRSTTTTFDSSDIIRQAFLEGAGLDTGADHRIQAAYFKKNGKLTTNWSKIKPGDHVFMMSYKGYRKSDYEGINKFKQRITHGGIYLGHGLFLHSYSQKSGGVRIDKVKGTHWQYRFIFGGNVVN